MTGSGTLADPFVIWDITDFQNINLDLTAYYQLGQDIDASATAGWNWNAGRGVFEGFVQLGSFSGDFDGQGFTISNLYMNWAAVWPNYVSIFLDITGRVTNVIFEDINLTNEEGTALHVECYALAGSCWGIHFENIRISGDILAHNTHVPAAVQIDAEAEGFCLGGGVTFTNCHTSVNVRALCDNVGIGSGAHACGFATSLSWARRCSATGNVIADTGRYPRAAGFTYTIGDGQWVAECYASGNVQVLNATLEGWAAGFAYRLTGTGRADDCYASGNVDASAIAAGFVALTLSANSILRNCFSFGQVNTAAISFGGFCADNSVGATIENCFWDIEASGVTRSDGGTGGTTDTMKLLSTFLNAGWNIEGITDVDMNNGYPFLSWQIPGSSPAWFIFLPGVVPPPLPSVVTLLATEIR